MNSASGTSVKHSTSSQREKRTLLKKRYRQSDQKCLRRNPQHLLRLPHSQQTVAPAVGADPVQHQNHDDGECERQTQNRVRGIVDMFAQTKDWSRLHSPAAPPG